MKESTIRYVDNQIRIVIPAHIRKTLNIAPGTPIEISLEDDGTIRIRPTYERCSICGASVEGVHHAEIKAGSEKKHICYECSQKILKHIMK